MLALLQATTDYQAMARQAFQYLTPEVILVVFACGALILDVMLPRGQKRWVAWACLTGLAFSFASLATLYTNVVRNSPPHTAFFEMIVIDDYAVMFKGIFLVGAALSILMAIKYLEVEGEQRGEYYSLILFAVAGMMFLASSVDLLSMFVSLELMAVSVYVLVAFLKRDRKSNAAAMKYFLLGAFSSAILLYGISLVYGLTGSTNLTKIATALPVVATPNFNPLNAASGADMRYLVLMALLLLAVGLLFKVAAVPFHIWAPDTYEGAPTSVTAFLSVGVKAASFAMFGRIFLYGLPSVRSTIAGDPTTNTSALPGWALLLGMIAAITMIWGNLAALRQSNIKRMLAYSAVVHAGYMLLGLVSGTEKGYTAFIAYLLIYTLTNLGVFGCIIALRRRGVTGDRSEDLNGLIKKSPLLTMMMTIFLLSLAGIPLTGGFIGRFYLITGLMENGNPWWTRLAILTIVMSVVSLYYYIRFIRAMYVNAEAEPQPLTLAKPLQVALVVAVLLVVFFGVYPKPLMNFTQRAAASQGFQTINDQQSKPPAATPVTPPGGSGRSPMGISPQ